MQVVLKFLALKRLAVTAADATVRCEEGYFSPDLQISALCQKNATFNNTLMCLPGKWLAK